MFNKPLCVRPTNIPAIAGLEDPRLNTASDSQIRAVPGRALPSSSEAWKLSEGALPSRPKVLSSRNAAQRKQEGTLQDSSQETEVPLLSDQLESDEDSIFPKYNGIGLGEREVPRGENIAVPN